MLKAIFVYTSIMFLGIYLGKKGFLKNILKKKLDNIITILLIIILFVMGIGFGKNKTVINSLAAMGVKSFILACSIVLFASISLYISNKIYDKIRQKNKM